MHEKLAGLRGLESFLEDLAGPPGPPAADPLERPSDPRSVPLEHRGWLVREPGREPVALCLSIREIGRGGALADCAEAPEPGEAVSFYLDPYREDEHEVPARVAGVTPGPRGGPRVRLEFWAPCPDYILERAIRGRGADPASPGTGAVAGAAGAPAA